jgi:hypothetical protein
MVRSTYAEILFDNILGKSTMHVIVSLNTCAPTQPIRIARAICKNPLQASCTVGSCCRHLCVTWAPHEWTVFHMGLAYTG